MARKINFGFIEQIDAEEDFVDRVINVKDTLCVVDAYSSTWGPTEALKAQFYYAVCECQDKGKRVKIVQAKVDKIKSLVEYKDAAYSNVLFYVDGKLKERVKGPQLPRVREHISTLAVEDKYPQVMVEA